MTTQKTSAPAAVRSEQPDALQTSGLSDDRARHLLSERVRFLVDQQRFATQNPIVAKFIEQSPKLPTYTLEIATQLLEETTTVDDVVESIKRDPALAGIVLKCANSARFGFERRIETFHHACVLLGFNAVYQLLLQEGIRNCMRNAPETRMILTHSCLISTLCYEVAKLSPRVRPQSATTIGLLHDVGKSVVILLSERRPEVQALQGLLHSGQIGGDLLRSWRLPERICQSLEFQDYPEFTQPEDLDSNFRMEVAVLYIAHLVEGIMLDTPISEDRMAFVDEYIEMLELPESSIQDLYFNRILPALTDQRDRLPPEVRDLSWVEIGGR